MGKQDDLKVQLPYIGVTDWWAHGNKGDDINIWNIEQDRGHGACTGQIVKDVAPNCNLFFGNISLIKDGDKITYIAVYDAQTKTTDESRECIENFIKRHKIKVITSSQSGTSCTEWIDMIRDLQKKYGLIIFNCAFNNGDDETHETIDTMFPVELCITVGALGWHNGHPRRMDYSSVGKELDFSQLILWYSGTSAATPCLAGMATMILNRYGDMSQQEMYQYLMMISKDLQEEGCDIYTGWGQPILPSFNRRYITMTTKLAQVIVDGKIQLIDTVPVNKEGTVFVPIRVISEILGYAVKPVFVNGLTSRVIITKGAMQVILDIDSNVMLINGKKVYLNFAPYVDENYRTQVPIRLVAEAFGCHVNWIQNEAKVQILEG